ncbi:hypothetical protein AB0A77_25360 [Streptomyces varsoviensis]|uniref:hypothetical protein n=1 Tax=Streptomyces varsoviensis TaxID=67373 RepID=UPI0033F62AAA
MPTYALKFEADPATDVTAIEDSFYEHFDGLIAESFGRLIVTVYIDGHANGASAAKCAAIDMRQKTGLITSRLERDLVDTSEISRRVDRSRESVRQIIHGERHKGAAPFPTPIGAPNGKKLWEWGVVNDWLLKNLPELADPERHLNRDEMAEIDGWLLRWRTLPQEQHVLSEFNEITAAERVTHREARASSKRASTAWVTSWNVRETTVTTGTGPLPSSPSTEGKRECLS